MYLSYWTAAVLSAYVLFCNHLNVVSNTKSVVSSVCTQYLRCARVIFYSINVRFFVIQVCFSNTNVYAVNLCRKRPLLSLIQKWHSCRISVIYTVAYPPPGMLSVLIIILFNTWFSVYFDDFCQQRIGF